MYKDESYKIVGAAMEVHNVIGCGFAEAVYQEALEMEFKLRGIPYEREKTFAINYKGMVLEKDFRIDFVCYDKIVVELKAVSTIVDEHYAQVYNYLKAGNMQLGLLVNFGNAQLEVKRILCSRKWKCM